MAATDLAANVKKQVEFYFGDSNFRRDKFLRGKADADPQGYIDLTVLTSFNRLKEMTEDIAVIADAVADSTVVQLSADKKKIRRAKPLPLTDDTPSRTVYMKGFPADCTLDELIAFCNEIAPTARVSMRRLKDEAHTFKGSVFVEFETAEGAKTALAKGATEEGIVFKGQKLESVQSKTAYAEGKKAERAKATTQPEFKREMTPGVIVQMTGLDSTATWTGVQDAASAVAVVKFTELENADAGHVAILRCATPTDAAKVIEAVAKTAAAEAAAAGSADTSTPEGCLDVALLGGKVPTAALLAGDAEQAYWEKVWAAQAERFRSQGKGRGQKRKRSRDPAPAGAAATAAAAAAAAATASAEPAAKKPAAE